MTSVKPVVVDEATIRHFDKPYTYDETKSFQPLPGCNWKMFQKEGERFIGKTYSGQLPFADKDDLLLHRDENNNKLHKTMVYFELADKKSKRHFAAGMTWLQHLTIGSLIQLWGEKDFTAMVTCIHPKAFSYDWVGIDPKVLAKDGSITFTSRASTSGLGKIEKAILGNLTWTPREL